MQISFSAAGIEKVGIPAVSKMLEKQIRSENETVYLKFTVSCMLFLGDAAETASTFLSM